MPSPNPRFATLVLAVGTLIFNLFAAFHLLSLWKFLKWEPESEWEGSEKYRVNGVRIFWCLLFAYFSVAAVACVVGLVGVLRRVPSYVRLYRDYSLADLCFCAFSTVGLALASFRPVVRSFICEELSRQPDLMRDLAETGFSIENCESWVERAVLVSVALTAVLLVIRLQFTLTVSSYYTQLVRSTFQHMQLHVVRPSSSDYTSPQRIYLLPTRVENAQYASPAIIYAPVPLNSISEEDARELDATEAWVSPPQHHHHRSHRRSGSGRISLPAEPGEPLFPHIDVKH